MSSNFFIIFWGFWGDKVDWQADAAGVRSPGGPARQGDQQLVSLKGSLCKYLQIRVKSIPICS